MKRCSPSKKLADILNRPAAIQQLGHRGGDIDVERLRHLMDEHDELQVWEIIRNAENDSFGYAMLVFFDGPPFIAIYAHTEGKGRDETEIGRDVLLHLIPLYFENIEEEVLYFYLARPVDQEVYDQLIEAGFDEDDENPTIDQTKEAAFIMWRHTYDAYYGDGTSEQEFGDVGDDYDY